MNTQLSEKEIQQAIRQLAYRKAYNQRPDVVEKRKVYMKKRAAEQKEAMKLFRRAQVDPKLAVELGLGTRSAL